MSRRKKTPEEIARKAKVRELMQELDINDMSDINALFKDFGGDILENGLEAELDDELGYSKYDYRNKDTANSAMDTARKHSKPFLARWSLMFPVTAKGSLSRNWYGNSKPP